MGVELGSESSVLEFESSDAFFEVGWCGSVRGWLNVDGLDGLEGRAGDGDLGGCDHRAHNVKFSSNLLILIIRSQSDL